jgi:hypothetical protein
MSIASTQRPHAGRLVDTLTLLWLSLLLLVVVLSLVLLQVFLVSICMVYNAVGCMVFANRVMKGLKAETGRVLL